MQRLEEKFCVLKQIDCLEKHQSILYQGKANITDQGMRYEEETGARNEILFLAEEIKILRKLEGQETSVVLRNNDLGHAEVRNDLGTLKFSSRLLHWKKSETSFEIEYQLQDNGKIILHTHLYCQWS